MDAGLALPLMVALIAVALAFDFFNGMNDAANAIATVVSTRVLSPQVAVLWAAFFNFVAFLVFGLHVAETVGRGIVEADIVSARLILAALIGALAWQVVTNRLGIPSSSSHAQPYRWKAHTRSIALISGNVSVNPLSDVGSQTMLATHEKKRGS